MRTPDVKTKTAAQSRPLWADALIALAIVAGIVWWLAGGSAPSYDAAVDYSTIVREERLRDYQTNHRRLSFRELAAFEYVEPARLAGIPTTTSFSTIPKDIRDLHGKRVSVDGFMMPLDYDGGVRTFVLNASYDMCQFGAPSIPNQRIDVTMAGGRRTVFVHTPIRVFGVMEVGEEFDNGQLVSIYRMKADAIYVGY